MNDLKRGVPVADESEDPITQGANPAAALALAAAGHDTNVSDAARAYLKKQVELANYQIADIRREDRIRHWSIRVRHVSDLMKLAFELSLAFIFVAIAFAIGTALWTAAHDDSVVIEAFSVPPDLAARGLTGQAIASQLEDKLGAMQAATDSARPPESYTNNWGGDIKVEIPNTGVSIGEFYRYLASWLGHQTHIRGELYRDGANVVIAARAGGDGGTKIEGRETELDKLLQQSAEAIYRQTQPYRYAAYIEFHGNLGEARAILVDLTQNGPTVLDRAWAYNGLAVLDGFVNSLEAASQDARKGTDLIPDFALAWLNQDGYSAALGHDEAGLAAAETAERLLEDGSRSGGVEMTPRARAISQAFEKADVAFYRNDFQESLADSQMAAKLPDYSGDVEFSRENVVGDYALLHDPDAARRAFAALPPADDLSTKLGRAISAFTLAYWTGDWRAVLQNPEKIQTIYAEVKKSPILVPSFPFVDFEPRELWPYSAYALAASGDVSAGGAMIAKTPLDCFVCLRIRGRIAALRHDWRSADAWFTRATKFAPSIPLGWSNWGGVLLQKGDLDGAIAKFDIAHQKGPHFADPLEMWGEALMQKNRSDLALAKFEEAAKYAPHWGRLHLEWGKALSFVGRKDDAATQFAIARGLGAN